MLHSSFAIVHMQELGVWFIDSWFTFLQFARFTVLGRYLGQSGLLILQLPSAESVEERRHGFYWRERTDCFEGKEREREREGVLCLLRATGVGVFYSKHLVWCFVLFRRVRNERG